MYSEIESDAVCFVEWAERIQEVFPDDHFVVEIRHVGETRRQFGFRATGSVSKELLAALRSEIDRRFQ